MTRYVGPRGEIVLWLAAFIGFWTLAGTLVNGTIHHDMVEAWAWGQEFQLGYYKHPPLFAWIAGAWFHLMPRDSWSFYLLAALNAAIGLAGVWRIASGQLGDATGRAALLLVILTPFYGVFALKYNANAVLLSLWPWTVYAFLRTLATGRPTHALAFGVLAGLSMLGKYYSVVLVASCLAASVVTPQARALYRTPAPYLAAAAAMAVVAPHVVWMLRNDFPTLGYAMSKTHGAHDAVVQRGLRAFMLAALFHLLPAVVLVYLLGNDSRGLVARIASGLGRRSLWPILVVAAGPPLLTLLACLLANVRISAQFLLPAFFMLPVAVLGLASIRIDRRRVAVATRAVGGIAVALLVIISLAERGGEVAGLDIRRRPFGPAAKEAAAVWHAATGRKLRIVGGDDHLAQLISFYAEDAPSVFTAFDVRKAPWINDSRLQRDGMLIACRGTAAACHTEFRSYGKSIMVRAWESATAPGGEAGEVHLVIVPPRSSAAALRLGP
jgi:4-amino-4-deoxy-L-arabinose transferase-like glycosyltransferase